ncbi:twin-arginine translocation signal domain-containing protein, partial [Alkalihalobacillus clausii]|nr:twin-arginine translocation signal domain-containing protein [Shouchella clausii]
MPRPSRRDLLKTAGAAGGLVLAPPLRAAGGPTAIDNPRAIVPLARG